MKKLFLIGVMFVGVQAFAQQNCEGARKKYLQMNPDVAEANMDAWEHYIQYGKKEGRVWYECVNELTPEAEPKLPESVSQEDMSITKSSNGKLLTMSFKVTKTFNTTDVENVKRYVHYYYSREGFNGFTPQISHKKDDWTFVFNK